jgi:hypothetical protein
MLGDFESNLIQFWDLNFGRKRGQLILQCMEKWTQGDLIKYYNGT